MKETDIQITTITLYITNIQVHMNTKELASRALKMKCIKA